MPAHAHLEPKLDARQIDALLAKAFPQLNQDGGVYGGHETLDIFPGGCTVRLNATERHIRPGGTVSGAALFMLADIGGYVCVLSHAGPDALSVTTNLSINFMRKSGIGPVDGHCRI